MNINDQKDDFESLAPETHNLRIHNADLPPKPNFSPLGLCSLGLLLFIGVTLGWGGNKQFGASRAIPATEPLIQVTLFNETGNTSTTEMVPLGRVLGLMNTNDDKRFTALVTILKNIDENMVILRDSCKATSTK